MRADQGRSRPEKEAAESLRQAPRGHAEQNWAQKGSAWGQTLLKITVLCSLWLWEKIACTEPQTPGLGPARP